MLKFLVVIIAIAALSCSCGQGKKEREPEALKDPRIGDVRKAYDADAAAIDAESDPKTGWAAKDCDGFAWEFERRSAEPREDDDAALAAATLEPGKYDRRPEHGCDYTWSRDMATIGLLPWAWERKRLDVLEAHVKYGEAHALLFGGFPAWKMGEPLGDGRTVYVPAEIGIMREMVVELGGPDNKAERIWPDTYPSGLKDFEANLQVMDIWLRGSVSEGPDMRASDGTITKTMYDRLQEHAAREPQNPKYQAILGIWTGNFAKAIDDVLDPSRPLGTYVRCGGDWCGLAERLFAERIILDRVSAP